MSSYECKLATREDVLNRWKYLIDIHPGKDIWVKFKENTLKHYDDGSMLIYYGFLDNEIICEATAYIKEEAFIGDIEDPLGLLNDNMAYLAAFRTNKEYEDHGYFSKLYHYMEDDLIKRGYTELSLGVNPKDVRDIEIYFHLGFTNYIKTEIENDENGSIIDFVNYYKKLL